MKASVEPVKASMEAMEAYVEAVEASMEGMEASMEAFMNLHVKFRECRWPKPTHDVRPRPNTDNPADCCCCVR